MGLAGFSSNYRTSSAWHSHSFQTSHTAQVCLCSSRGGIPVILTPFVLNDFLVQLVLLLPSVLPVLLHLVTELWSPVSVILVFLLPHQRSAKQLCKYLGFELNIL